MKMEVVLINNYILIPFDSKDSAIYIGSDSLLATQVRGNEQHVCIRKNNIPSYLLALYKREDKRYLVISLQAHEKEDLVKIWTNFIYNNSKNQDILFNENELLVTYDRGYITKEVTSIKTEKQIRIDAKAYGIANLTIRTIEEQTLCDKTAAYAVPTGRQVRLWGYLKKLADSTPEEKKKKLSCVLRYFEYLIEAVQEEYVNNQKFLNIQDERILVDPVAEQLVFPVHDGDQYLSAADVFLERLMLFLPTILSSNLSEPVSLDTSKMNERSDYKICLSQLAPSINDLIEKLNRSILKNGQAWIAKEQTFQDYIKKIKQHLDQVQDKLLLDNETAPVCTPPATYLEYIQESYRGVFFCNYSALPNGNRER